MESIYFTNPPFLVDLFAHLSLFAQVLHKNRASSKSIKCYPCFNSYKVIILQANIAWPSFHEHLCSHTNIKTLNVLKIDSEQTQKYAPPFFPRFHWMTHGTTFSFKLRFLSFLYLFIKVLAECTYKPMSTYDLFPFTRQFYKIHCTSMPDFPSQSPQISIKHKQFNMN